MNKSEKQQIEQLNKSNISYSDLLKLFGEKKISFNVFEHVAKHISLTKAELRENW